MNSQVEVRLMEGLSREEPGPSRSRRTTLPGSSAALGELTRPRPAALRVTIKIAIAFTIAIGAACGLALAATEAGLPRPFPSEELAGGDTTVFDARHSAFGRALGNLERRHWLPMRAGKELFESPWHPPRTEAKPEARRGLGPLHNKTACTDCHFRDGRGGPPSRPQRTTSGSLQLTPPPLIARLGFGQTDSEALQRDAPDPIYGYQLNERGIGLAAEGRLRVDYDEVAGSFADGEPFRLRRPRVRIDRLSQGPLHPATQVSLRVPPTLIGLGLLEAVPIAQLESLEDPEDRDQDGISGRLQRIEDQAGTRIGRFGWKAAQPDLESQAARAFFEDLGVISDRFPAANCPPASDICRRLAGAEIELTAIQLERVALYLRLLAPPARRDWQQPRVLQGRELFSSLGCADCHRPALQTAPVSSGELRVVALGGQTIRPFTDLLLHDMGLDLADGIAEHSASPAEWRTPPLWGLGLIEGVNGHLRLLHDGRAESIQEAILWHGGEGERAREAYRHLNRHERTALLRFLESL